MADNIDFNAAADELKAQSSLTPSSAYSPSTIDFNAAADALKAAQQAPQGGTAAPAASPVAGSPQSPPAASPANPQEAAAEAQLHSMGMPVDPADAGPQASDTEPMDKSGVVGGLAIGATQDILNTKDAVTSGFGLLGEPPSESERSAWRQSLDVQAKRNADDTPAGGFAQSIGAATVSLLGAGKLTLAVGGGLKVGAGIGAALSAAGSEAHEANWVNVLSKVPGVPLPLTQYLASSPEDSTSLGYLKNALVSLGFDMGLVTTVGLGAKLIKSLHGGDSAAIQAAGDDLEADIKAHVQAGQQKGAQSAATPVAPVTPPESLSPGEAAVRSELTPAGKTGGPAIAGAGDQTGDANIAATTQSPF